MSYVLALDQGTTSSRAILFSADGTIVAQSQHEFQQFYPKSGWVEHDPIDILTRQLGSAVEALGKAGIRPRDVAAIGITNQRETTSSGIAQPASRSITPSSGRIAEPLPQCQKLMESGRGKESSATAPACVIDPYFSATKIAWILDNVPGARARAEAGKLAFGTVDTWLIWHLTSGGST